MVAWLACALACAAFARAQNVPHIGYVYPAGGRAGSTFQIVVGGQYLGNVSNIFITGDGAQAEFMESNRPLGQKEFNELRDRLKILQEKRQAARKSPGGTNGWTTADEREIAGIPEKVFKNPPNRQGNPAIAETVTVRVTLHTNAASGDREIRLGAPSGLSNPLRFCIGQLPEISNQPAKTYTPEAQRILERLGKKIPAAAHQPETRITLPAVVNGQIMPGAADRYRFSARKGQRLVIAVSARGLIPYLPDAVPGWFQATLAIFDAKGTERAYQDDFKFNPDPVLYHEVAHDGDLIIEIKDAIYRGREDFVYRIAIGELPFVTGVFPLGGQAAMTTAVELHGWNLATKNLIQNVKFADPGIHQLSAGDASVFNLASFAIDTLPESHEQEANDTPGGAQPVTLPVILNGRIASPGDRDVFRFEGEAGSELVAEVTARRLKSLLDSALQLTDAAGKQIGFSDDNEDKGAGLETHHADSYLRATLPAKGTYFVQLRDTQSHGGADFGYRLRLSAPQPDFALRIVPSSVSVRAGGSAPLTAFVLRRDGFTNAISLALSDASAGFSLNGATIPAGQDKVRFTLTAPPTGQTAPVYLSLTGRAMIQGRTISRPAVPADDLMQAFIYRHLVPAQEFAVAVTGRGQPKLKIISPKPVKIPAGGTIRVRLDPGGPRFAENFLLELSEPPEGITLKTISEPTGGLEVELAAADKLKPGQTGNLIVNVIALRTPDNKAKPATARRIVAGTLPALPFEITAP